MEETRFSPRVLRRRLEDALKLRASDSKEVRTYTIRV